MAATSETIKDVIIQRLNAWDMMVPLMEKHGPSKIMEVIEDSASFYAGCEEIGSSDAANMVDSAVRQLGEPSIFNR